MSLTHSNSLLIWNNRVSHVSVESISFSFKMELICDGLFPTMHVLWEEILLSTETITYAVVPAA